MIKVGAKRAVAYLIFFFRKAAMGHGGVQKIYAFNSQQPLVCFCLKLNTNGVGLALGKPPKNFHICGEKKKGMPRIKN